jgi:hypothetical protein
MKSPKQHAERELFGKFPRKSSQFKEKSFAIVKTFGGLRQISSFLLFEVAIIS